jgi:hypothetical protein
MRTEGKGAGDAELPHDLKAGAVHQAELAPVSDKHGANRLKMDLFVDPNNIQDRYNISLKQVNRFQTKAALEKGDCFNEYVIAASDLCFLQ